MGIIVYHSYSIPTRTLKDKRTKYKRYAYPLNGMLVV